MLLYIKLFSVLNALQNIFYEKNFDKRNTQTFLGGCKEKFWFYLEVMVIVIVINIAFRLYPYISNESTSLVSLLLLCISMGVGFIIQIGKTKIVLNISSGKPVEYGQLFDGVKFFWRFVGAGFLYMFIVFIGFILLIVPGIIWSIKYGQWRYLMVDKDLRIIESLKKSGELTYGSKFDIAVVGFAVFVIITISIIPLGLGLLASIPLAFLVPGYINQKLNTSKTETEASSQIPTETPAPFVLLS